MRESEKRGDLTGEEGPTTSDRDFLAFSFILNLQFVSFYSRSTLFDPVYS